MPAPIVRHGQTCATALALLALVACFGSGNRRPPTNAEMVSHASVVGRWEGTYRARTVERDGRFRLVVEEHGDSLAGTLDLLGVAALPLNTVPSSGTTTPNANADIVRVNVPSITLDGIRARFRSTSYWDPGCGCALTLDLTGFVVADTLAGYFDAVGTALTATERGGRWRAVRVR